MPRPTAITPVSGAQTHINICVHGDPGVGKSVLAGTSPKALILTHNPDETSSAAAHGSKADKWVVTNLDELTEALEYVKHEGVREYQWVWIDNLTLVQEFSMDFHMENLKASKPHRDQFVPDKPEYLQIQNRLGYLVRQFVATPIHFGWTATTERYEKDDGTIVHLPMLQGGQGKFSTKLCSMMGVIGYMIAVKPKDAPEERRLFVNKRQTFYARTRYPSLAVNGGLLKNPHVPGMMRLIAKDLPTLQGVPATPAKAARTAATK